MALQQISDAYMAVLEELEWSVGDIRDNGDAELIKDLPDGGEYSITVPIDDLPMTINGEADAFSISDYIDRAEDEALHLELTGRPVPVNLKLPWVANEAAFIKGTLKELANALASVKADG